ncbi:MAG: SpoIIIAH-like family protein [Peptococcaceae bacterium]|jgi:stage III sporulation protein AH|nr:SpoIIIAH-like family protein [Peptococcaceae bacterium]
MAFQVSRRLVTLSILVILGAALIFIGVRTRPATSAETVPPPSQPVAVTTMPPVAGPTPSRDQATRDSFFAEYRMNRDRALSLEAALLRDVVDNSRSGADARLKAQDDLLRLGREQALLVELEGLAHAEGFNDAVVFLENQGLTVVVGPGHVSAARATGLVQVLARQAGVPPANVAIIQRP